MNFRNVFFFSSRRRHTRWPRDWSSDVCSSDLRRFAARAEAVRVVFTVVLVDVGVDPVPPARARSVFADAVAAVLGAGTALKSRWPLLGEVSPWRVACAASGGRLLAPCWPPVASNTS